MTAIRTPDRHLRVFVSSTLGELAEERAAVARAITSLRMAPVMFELGARAHPPQELYRAYLAQSDIFVAIYWQRYGWVGPGMSISGLEDEFRLSDGMPRLLYLKAPAPGREPRLTAMIDQIKARGTDSYRTFRSMRELARLVRDDLAVLLSERFASPPDGPGQAKGEGPGTAATHDDRVHPAHPVPTPSTTLVGREQDIANVLGLVASSGTRLVTLTGPGGVGKTRLAIAVAERSEDRYPNAVAFVSLAAVTDDASVLPAIASALAIPMDAGQDVLEAVAERVGDAPFLLVLDNLEQVVGVAPMLNELLTRCEGLVILASSRTALRLRAEREYPVSGLAVPVDPEAESVEALVSLPAVRLFVDRAKAVRYDFELTDENVQDVVAICRRLDGLPLAIELAAARIRLLSPAALRERLDSSLDALGSGPVDLPERQRTLRAAVDWSIGLLDDDERDLFDRMGVFVDGWTLDAAVAITGMPEDRVLDLLDTLVGHSLMVIDPSMPEPRYRMLETIRTVSADRLTRRADRDEVERRHAAFFRELGESADRSDPSRGDWGYRLRPDEGNLVRAIRWYLEHDISPLPHLFRTLWFFWQLRDYLAPARGWIRELAARSGELDARAQAELAVISAVTAAEVGDDDGARTALLAIDGLGPQVGDPSLESAARLATSWVLPIEGDVEGALQAAVEARDGFRERQETFQGWAWFTVGLLQLSLGRLDEARTSLIESETLGSRYGNSWLESAARTQLATWAVRAGRLDEARRYLAGSVELDRGAEPSIQAITFGLVAGARLGLAEGDPERAAKWLAGADGLRRRTGTVTWPSMRQDEAALAAAISDALPEGSSERISAGGATVTRREAIDLLAGLGSTDGAGRG
jgi:predicted ATPase